MTRAGQVSLFLFYLPPPGTAILRFSDPRQPFRRIVRRVHVSRGSRIKNPGADTTAEGEGVHAAAILKSRSCGGYGSIAPTGSAVAYPRDKVRLGSKMQRRQQRRPGGGGDMRPQSNAR